MISVLIPARNEARNLPRLLQRLREMPQIGEIIVADGGSDDATVAVAMKLGARVVEGARGRGAQQNAAALVSSGEILWFLHADSLPARGCGAQIEAAMRRGACGGNFRMKFEARGFWPRLFEIIARGQRVLGIYYGDSGIWVRREAWQQLGGFENWPLFEDLDFARRLERFARARGVKTACCAGRLRVSARRFGPQPWRLLGFWLALQLGFQLGMAPDVLARLYHRGDKR